MKQSYAVMIPVHVSAESPMGALEEAIDILNDDSNYFVIWDGYVNKSDYTIEDMENAGWTYVEVP